MRAIFTSVHPGHYVPIIDTRSPACQRKNGSIRANYSFVSQTNHASQISFAIDESQIPRNGKPCTFNSADNASGRARSPIQDMTSFIDDRRDQYGVEPICKVLPIASSSYYARKVAKIDPQKLSPCARRDNTLRPVIKQVFKHNRSVYSVRKVWYQMQREDYDVARCTVAWLMRDMGLRGVIGGKSQRARQSAVRPTSAPLIWSIGSLKQRPRTSFGGQTSPMSRRGPALFTWPSSLISLTMRSSDVCLIFLILHSMK